MLAGVRRSDHTVASVRERPWFCSNFAPCCLDHVRNLVASSLYRYLVTDCDGGDLSAQTRLVLCRNKDRIGWRYIHPFKVFPTIAILMNISIVIARAFPRFLSSKEISDIAHGSEFD